MPQWGVAGYILLEYAFYVIAIILDHRDVIAITFEDIVANQIP